MSDKNPGQRLLEAGLKLTHHDMMQTTTLYTAATFEEKGETKEAYPYARSRTATNISLSATLAPSST